MTACYHRHPLWRGARVPTYAPLDQFVMRKRLGSQVDRHQQGSRLAGAAATR
jgi:hypothetical protein